MNTSPAEQKPAADVIPLSFTQEFLCMFGTDEESGPFGPRYHTVRGWRVSGRLDPDVLKRALLDVVTRHEALRTAIVTGETQRQEVHAPAAPEFRIDDLAGLDTPGGRERVADEFLNRLETEELSVRQLPHLRVVVGRLDDADWVLALIAHHVSIDGWSMELIMRDVAACYDARSAGAEPFLKPVRQYREHSAWHRAHFTPAVLGEATNYWRTKLAGARMLGLSNDRSRVPDTERVTAVHRFRIDLDLTKAALDFARTSRSSFFIVAMAVQNLVMRELTGSTDIVLPTITFGRNHSDYENTVGPFFNFVPLRTDLAACTTLRDVFIETRRTCLEAQTQEIPFAFILRDSPELMATFEDPGVTVCAFQTFQYPNENTGRMGDLSFTEVRRRLVSQPIGSDIPDGTLCTLEIDQTDGTCGNLRYNSVEYDSATLDRWVSLFRNLLRTLVTTPETAVDTALRQS